MNKRYERIDKSKINLLYIASLFGYEIDKKAGAKGNVIIMRRSFDDGKIAVYHNSNGYAFADLRSESNNDHLPTVSGDAIRFVEIEKRCGFIEAKQYILDNTTEKAVSIPEYRYTTQAKPQEKEYKPHAHWQKKHDASQPASNNSYLANERGLLPELLANCRDIRVSTNNTPLFFYRDSKCFLTACEYRKGTRKAFDTDSKKSLFFVNMPEPQQKFIVVCESAIDALSFAQLLLLSNAPIEQYLIIAHGGTLNIYQCEQVLKLAQKGERRVILAQDNDDAGEELAARLGNYLHKNGIPSKRKKPGLKDWNEVLTASQH